MEEESALSWLIDLLEARGVSVRTEPFKSPSDRAGGLCRVEGHSLVLLDSNARPGERLRALVEAIEGLGLERLGLSGSDLRPEILSLLNRRGRMKWPHKRSAPSLVRAPRRWSPKS